MDLLAGKTPWIIGIAGALALAGIVSGILFNAWAPAAAPAPAKLPASPEEPAAPIAGGASADFVPSDRPPFPNPAADRAGGKLLVGGVSNPVGPVNPVAPQVAAQARPASITISPERDWNPVRTQHSFTVTVSEADGAPAGGVEVELMLNRSGDAVGDILSLGGENPRKVDRAFGRVITDANGQATLTITAAREGYTDVTAYAPQIEDAAARQVFAVKHWVDMEAQFPGDSVNLVGTDHPMVAQVLRATDGRPLPGVEVVWTITGDDPDATINNAGTSVATRSDEQGLARAVLRQVAPASGANRVRIEVVHDSGTVLFHDTVAKQWTAPSLQVDKTAPETMGLLKEGEFTVTVVNNGDNTATGVTLTDQLPDGLAFVSSAPRETQVAGATVTWNLGDMAPGAAATVSLTLQGTEAGAQINRAIAVSAEGFTSQDDTMTYIVPGSLSLTKSGPESVNLGENITYEITVANTGDGALRRVAITDTLPEGVTLTATEPGADFRNSAVARWSIALLDAGERRTFRVSMTADRAGTALNAVKADSAEGASAEAQAATRVLDSNVTVSKLVDREAVLVGDEATFTITVANEGDGAAADLAVVSALPTGLELVASEPAASGRVLRWRIATLEAGGSATFTVVVRATAAGTYTTSARALGRDTNAAAEVTLAALTADLILRKTASDSVYVGGEGDYTITAVNTGQADLTGVTITDTIPTGMSYVSSDNDGVAEGGTVTWDIGDLPSGQSVAVTVRLKGEAAGNVVSTANITSDQGAQARVSLDIAVLSATGAYLRISDDVDPLGVGEAGSYTVTVRNRSGETAISRVRLTVALPEELEILTAEGGTIDGSQVTYGVIESLAAGAEQTFTITVRGLSAGEAVATATMTYAEFSQAITDREETTIVSR